MTRCSFTRDELAESCRLETKSLIQEVLFESEPTLDICGHYVSVVFRIKRKRSANTIKYMLENDNKIKIRIYL
jgi:hypothetical protein